MNRDIKFRMWIPDKSPGGRMVFRGIYDLNWYTHPTECRLYREIRQRDHQFPLMQFTGLKDINGKEIYEGDIIKFDEWKPKEVIWQNKGVACFSLGNTAAFLASYDEYELIGNIYENPELLIKE